MTRHETDESLPLVLSSQTFPIIRQIAAEMPGGFFIYHADQKQELIYANKALIKMFKGSSLEEFKEYTGFRFQGLVHPEDWPRVSEDMQRQITESDKGPGCAEYRIICKDSSVRWLKSHSHFVSTDCFGDIFYIFAEDTTERHLKEQCASLLDRKRLKALEQLEHTNTALRLVHEILSSGMWSMEFNERGQMVSVFWSDEFRAMLGYQDQNDFPDVLESWSDLLHPEDKEQVLREYYDTISDYSGKKIYDVEYRLLTKDLGYRWFQANGKLSRRADGSPITYVGMFVDITQRKQMDEELETQHRLLEKALKQAQRADRAKTAFLNNMSHDIRTPMNAIIGFTSLASSHIDNQEQLKSYLSKIMSASSHLLSLINDVLDMSRIESGKVQLKETPCSLNAIMRDLQTIAQADIHAKQLDFSIDMDVVHDTVVCDRLRLNQVLLNIISNALKFTSPHGKIHVRVSEALNAPEGYGAYTFQIRDTGIGMSPEFLQHIFKPFERERTSTVSGIQGTGLGMTITKNIVDMMYGTIHVASEQGKGSEFTLSFQFPLSDEPLPASEEETPAWRGMENLFSGRRILLAEDNELNQEIAVTILEEAGFTVETASDGSQAVEQVKRSAEQPYDLVLMDIQMPVMDGCEATRIIRALDDPRLSSLPIIAMTANAFEEDKQRVLDAGMNAHLGKPFEIDKLMDVLRENLGAAGTSIL